MLKSLIVGAILFIAFCTGIFFYAEWQKKRFDASLPKPPATEKKEAPRDASTGHRDSAHEHAESHDSEPAADETHEPAGVETHEHPVQEAHHDRSLSAGIAGERFPHANKEAALEPETATKPSKGRMTYTLDDLRDPYKRVKIMRGGLVKKYGDTPEVNEFLGLELKIATEATYTGEDSVRHAQLLAKLYPHPDHDRALETMKRVVEHAGGKDAVFTSLRHLPKNAKIVYPDGSPASLD